MIGYSGLNIDGVDSKGKVIPIQNGEGVLILKEGKMKKI